MRIRWLDISAYGLLMGRRVEFIDGLTVVFGRNEAGKTTLKRFVETMLFGFDDDDVTCYTPWHARDRDFGGELSYEPSGGQAFLVRRHYDPSVKLKRNREQALVLLGPDGAGGQAELSADEIGPVHLRQRRAIFRTVFSIDLRALVGLEDLARDEQEAVARVFFRELATVGEVANPSKVAAAILDRAQRICRFGGSRKRAETDTFRKEELGAARADLRNAKADQEKAEQTLASVAEYRARRAELVEERDRVQAELSRQQRIGPAAQTFRRLTEARTALAQLQDVADLDEGAIRGLEEKLARRSAAADLRDQRREDRDAIARRLSNLREQLDAFAGVLAESAAIERLAGLCDFHERLAEQLAQQAEDIRARRARLADELADIAAGDDPLACRALRMTQAERDARIGEIESHTERSREASARAVRLGELTDRVEKLGSQIEQIERRIPDGFPADYKPAQLRELLAVRREMERIDNLRQAVDERRRQVKADRQHLEVLRRETAGREGALRAAGPPFYWALWAAVLLIGLAAAVYYGYAQQVAPAVAGALAAAAGLWNLVELWRRRRAALRGDELVAASPAVQSLVARIKMGEDDLEHRAPSLEEDQRRLARRYAGAGLSGAPDARALEDAIARLQTFDDCAADHHRLSELRREHEELCAQADALRADVDADARRAESSRRRIEQALAGLDLVVPDDWTPRQLRDRLDLATRVGERLEDLERERRSLNHQQRQHEQFLIEVGSLAENVVGADGVSRVIAAGQDAAAPAHAATPPPDPQDQPLAFVRHMAGLLGQATALRERASQCEAQVQDARSRLARAEERLGQIDQEIAEKLRQLGLETVDALGALRAKLKRRSELSVTARSLAEQFEDLRRSAGLPDDWAPEPEADGAAEGDLSEEPPERLRGRLDDVAQQIAQIDEEIIRREQELARLEAGMSVAVAQGAYEAALDRLAEMHEEFDTCLVAYRLLERGMRRYQQQRQPGIVRAAQHYLHELTAGRYDMLQTDLLDRSQQLGEIYVVPAAGQPRDAKYFSRGAREQVYLALRLALADELSQLEPLPLIVDDALVNFDDPRFASTVDLLARLSDERQIIFLTCHDGIRDALTERGAAVREL